MTLLSSVLAAALVAQVVVRDGLQEARSAQPQGTARVTVLVTSRETGTVQPVRRASVVLSNTSTGLQRTDVTDDEGKFTFDQLPPGRYTLEASKGGYVRMPYGARRYDMPGTPIALADGQQLSNLQIELPRGAVIAGTVLDPTGKPPVGTTVLLMQWRVVDGVRRLVSPAVLRLAGGLPLAPVDQTGAYRLYGLPAGEYVVSVRLRNPMPPGQAPRAVGQPLTTSFSTTYYPGTADPNAAVPIKVGAGEEHTGADFRAQLVASSNISGTVVLPPGPPRSTRLVLVPDGPFANGVNTVPSGQFFIGGVPPGQYTIWARSLPSGPAPLRDDGGPALWGMTTIATSGSDLTDVVITMQPSMTASGKVVLEATRTPGPALAGIDVVLTPVQAVTNLSYALRVVAKTDATGAWATPGLTPGKYTVQALVGGAAAVGAQNQNQWTVKSATLAGRDLLDFPIDVGPNESLTDIVVTLTDAKQELSGVFSNSAGAHPEGYTMVLFPDDAKLRVSGSRRVRTAQPATDGRFVFQTLPTGAYRLAVVQELGPDDATSPTFLEQLIPASIPVTLAPGETKVQDVRIQ
jgi:uncharacterized protein (DUF2141 family)